MKYYVYERIWDLTIFDEYKLKKYKLKKAIYVYIGYSGEKSLNTRTSKWKNHILNDRPNVSKTIKTFITNLEEFYKNELNINDEEINNIIFRQSTNIVEEYDTKKQAQKGEALLTGYYHMVHELSILNLGSPKYILLSFKDSNLKTDYNDDKLELYTNKNKL